MTSALSSQLTALSTSNKTTLALIQRLAKLNFQPGSVPLKDGDEGDVRAELSSEIHENLKQQEEELELLRQEVEEITATGRGNRGRANSEKDSEKARIAVQVTRLGEDLKNTRAQFRQAQLTAKRNALLAQQKERDLLLNSLQSGSGTPISTSQRRRQQNQNLTADELVTNASSDVTAALRRTHQLMTSELQRSRFAQETLETSQAALRELSERYSTLDNLLSSSRTLVTSLLKSQKSDTWYLETALYILIVTIVWLVFRRLLYGPLWWFLWLPIKLAYRTVYFTLSSIGLVGGSATAAVTTTRKPLIVKPSADSGPPRIQRGVNQGDYIDPKDLPYIRSGQGGYGAKMGVGEQPGQPNKQESLSDKVGKTAEQAANAVVGEQKVEGGEEVKEKVEGEGKEQVRRGDGTVLPERSEQPRNPKKRMMDTGEEIRKRDEL